MTKLEEFEKKLKRYQRRYQKLLKNTALEGPRWGRSSDELLDTQLPVLETAIVEIKKEIAGLKRKRKSK